MSAEPIQNPLFDEPLGITLRHARQRKELSIESVARQLKLPVSVIESMEKEAWQNLGAPIYVKSYLDGYLRLLGLPAALAGQVRASRNEPTLVAMTPSNKVQRSLDRSWRRIVYMVMTGVLVGSVAMLAVHLQGKALPSEPISLGTPLDIESAIADAPATPALPVAAVDDPIAEPAQDATDQAIEVAPIAASLAPLPAPAAGALQLRFRGESWVDISDAQGRSIERGMVAIGTEFSYPAGSVGRLVLGNASAVEVLHDGRVVDLAPYSTENVARFEVSSEGRISAPAQ
jgi:cytoskeleton protein RodZ